LPDFDIVLKLPRNPLFPEGTPPFRDVVCPVMIQMAALAKAREIAIGVIGGVMVKVRHRQPHADKALVRLNPIWLLTAPDRCAIRRLKTACLCIKDEILAAARAAQNHQVIRNAAPFAPVACLLTAAAADVLPVCRVKALVHRHKNCLV
jgi:hypothetical protein